MSDVDELIAFLRLLPADAGMINWELTHDGGTGYTFVSTVIFTVPPGEPAPRPGAWPALPTGG